MGIDNSKWTRSKDDSVSQESVSKRAPLKTVKKASRSLGKKATNGTKKFAIKTAKIARTTARVTSKTTKKAHYQTVKRPHAYMQSNWQWYARWHAWPKHSIIHSAGLSIYFVLVGLMVFSSLRFALAADLTNNWNFSNSGDYTADSGLDLSAGASLAAQNYTADANTAALLHLDENSGNIASDSSSYANNANLIGSPTFGSGNLNNSLSLSGEGQFAKLPNSTSLNPNGQQSIEAWTKLTNTFDSSSDNQDLGIVDKGNYKMYYDRGNGKIHYELADATASSWTRQAGVDTKNSWDQDGKTAVRSITKSGPNTFVGLGVGTGDAEVWRWDGSTWAQIGGDGKNSSWADQQFENVMSLAINGNALYAGLGSGTGDSEVWSCQVTDGCTTWTKVGGDGLGWAVNKYETVSTMQVYGGSLYAGLGTGADDAEVWRYDGGTTWVRVGGSGTGWIANIYEEVVSMTTDGSNLYAGLGNTAGDAEIYKYNGATWTKIAGDGVNSSWVSGIEQVNSMTYFGGNLYAGTALTAGDGDVWKFNGATWSQIGGDGTGWAVSTYEGVYSLANDGTNLYAGLGTSNGDGEVYKYDGSSWSKLGGDSVNSSWTSSQGDAILAMYYDGSQLITGTYDAGGDSMLWSWSGTDWTRLGGGYVNNSWGFYGMGSIESFTVNNSKMYAGTSGVAGAGMVWEFDGNSWRVIGGQGLNNSWAADSIEAVYSLQSYKGDLYAGLGLSANDAQVWKWDGATWTQVGGNSLNSGWTAIYEAVSVLGIYNDKLYAGLGNSTNDAEVWEYDGSSWTKVGGDGVNSSWVGGQQVLSISVYDGQIYAGLGNSANVGQVWRWSGSGSWEQVGGNGLNSSWSSGVDEVYVMRVFNGKLYAGLGKLTGSAAVWEYDGSSWTKVGGDDLNNSWTTGTYERVRSMTVYNGELWAGIGDTTGDGEAWKYDGTNWIKMAGNSLNSGWPNTVEMVTAMMPYNGKLYVGTGSTANADNYVWSYGNNAFLSSNTSSFDTNWHHIAGTYDGTTMKIYIDGVLDASSTVSVSAPSSNSPLLIGSTYGSGARGEGQGYFKGQIDEFRLSNTARTNFITKPYSNSEKAVSLATAVRKNGVASWGGFTSSETTAGGAITYRLSDDDGVSWKYWNGSGWTASTGLTDANPVSTINTNIATFPVTFSGIKWQAVLKGDGTQKVTLNSVELAANSDLVAPGTNASNIVAKKSNGGSVLASNAWLNGASPYFSWDAATDAGAGIRGYCLYLGQTGSSDPETTKGLLGTSPVDTNGHCQFTVSSNSIDLATAGYLGTALTSSNSAYYLNVKAIDNAGNVFGTSEQFQFRFDNTAPTNPGFISAPSGFINTKSATITWPTTGGQAALDGNSGLSGLQYRFNSGSWYGDGHIGTGDASDLLVNDGTYITTDPSPPDSNDITDGVNTIYMRTWDNAGNVSTTYTTAALKVNTSGAPTEPQNVTPTPTTNTTNSFAFNWAPPSTFVGSANNITYCYTINTLPTVSNCSFTTAGDTDLAAGAYATQPGANTFYVVARDESGNINYASYASVNFTANTPAPGLPINMDVADVSVKASNNWRLAITWDEPISVGAGISSYRVFRSTDNASYSQVGSSSSPSYIDTGLSQQTYYYRVRACDSANNCSADSAVVSEIPTGKFTTPAILASDPTTSGVTTKRAKISWSTDRTSDSKISIGTTSGEYSPSEIGNSAQVTAHTIDLDNLAAGTTYYYVAKWTDVDGNTGTSQEYTFTTAPAPVLKEVTTLSVNLSSTTLQFTVKDATKVELQYGKSDSFGGVKAINTSLAESTYALEIDGLDDGVKYLYRIQMYDSEGGKYQSSIFSFTTPPRPKISNLRFQPLAGEPTSTQQVTWDTNIPANSIISYGKVGTTGTLIQAQEQKTAHDMVIRGLEDNSEYFLIAQGRDGNGNVAVSDRQVFKTALDTRAPMISDIVIEPTIRGSGAEARGQIIVSWKTDEPSTSQVAFSEGSSAQTFNNKTAEDAQLTTEHIVIISDLAPSKVYSIMPVSKDKSGNPSVTASQAAIVGRASDSVLNIVLNTLRKVFGL